MKRLYIILSMILYVSLNVYATSPCYPHGTGQPTIIFTISDKKVVGEAEFSISETKKVVFAKGNLMYQPSTKKWRIASRQYDFVGGDNKKDNIPNGRHGTIWANGVQCSNTSGNHVRNYTGWLDVFAWGTSGWYGDDDGEDDLKTYTWRLANNPNQKVTCNPYDLGHKDSVCLILGGDEYQGLTGAYANADWGIRNNEILGGSTDSVFRTPTKEEFDYLLSRRPNARSLSARGHIRLFGIGSAPDTIVNGLILLPDNWNPAILPETPIITDADGNEYYETNEFTAAEWQILEEDGAIFLPATGNTSKFNRSGYYWTSTSWKNKSAWNVEFGGYGWNGHESDAQTKAADKSSGRAVRLIMEITTDEVIETPPSPITCDDYEKVDVPGRGGTITSVQNPLDHCMWKLKATPVDDYKFAYWVDLNGNKTYTDSANIAIDTKINSVAMQAVFVKSDAYIHEWGADSIVYRSDTTNIFNGANTGYGIMAINNTVIENTEIVKSDFGVWKQKIVSDFNDNAHAGKKVHFVLLDACHKPSATFDTIMPIMIYGDSLASNIDFHNDIHTNVNVFGSLTINANTTINGILDIHPTGKVVVNNSKELETGGIIMRGNGITKNWPQLVANGSIINHHNDTIYYDYTLDQHEYYPLALPYTTACRLVHNPMTGKASSFLSFYYDTDVRSTGNYGWFEYDDLADGAAFEAGKGYIVYAVPMKWKGSRQKEAIMRFPMKANLAGSESEKTVDIRCSEVKAESQTHHNWNLIGNPYLAEFTVNTTSDTTKLLPGYYGWDAEESKYDIVYPEDGESIRYITYSLDGYRSYEQDFLRGFTMKPFNSYFVQAKEGNALTFARADRRQNAPRRYNRGSLELQNELEIGIIISQNNSSDHTGIIFGNYSDDYEINADLNKEFGNDGNISIYSIINNNLLAFQAMSYDYLFRPISIGYKNVKMEPITISFDENRYSFEDIDALWLTDIELNKYTNLLVEDYTFMPSTTQDNNRFYLTLEISHKDDVGTSLEETKSETNENIFNIFGYNINKSDRLPNGFYIIVDENGNCRKELIIK